MNIFGLIFTASELWLLGICGALCLALIGAQVTRAESNRNKHMQAAAIFRSVLLTELEGIVPVNGLWDQEIYARIKRIVPVIKRAALEFRPTIPIYRKRKFNSAVIAYCEQSENINWNQAVADAFDGDRIKKTQKEKFTECVDALLSFTE